MKQYLLLAVVLASLLVCAPHLAAQSRNSASNPGIIPGKHRGAVIAIVRDGNGRIISAGEDGFLAIWNRDAAEDRFQISPYGITSMVLRPGKPQVAVVESDGLGLYRISAWDYEAKKNLFTLRFRDSVTYINYSGSGGFLIVSRSGRTGAVFIHSETGEILESPENLSGSIAFATTSRSEKTMICYLSSGLLSYWDLEAGTDLQHFDVPPNIQSPVLFGNNRFLGGFDSQGLIVLDAVTGTTLARSQFISSGTIFLDSPDSSPGQSQRPGGAVQFYCLSSDGGSAQVYRMEIDLSGRLSNISRRTAATAGAITSCASADGENVILGTGQGTLWLLARNGIRAMDTGNPERITDAAASASAIGFISAGGSLGYIPLDYSLLESADVLTPDDAGTYTSITSDPSVSSSIFLLWQPEAGRSVPVLKTLLGPPKEGRSSQRFLDKLSLRVPLRSAVLMDSNILFLDTSGAISVLNRDSGDVYFSYSAAGSVDAAFIKGDAIILGRSAVTGNTPFMTVNTSTGETVPLPYPAVAGVRVYRGSSGTIYGAAIEQTGGNIQTSIVRLDNTNPARSERLVEYSGEDSSFAMAESGGNLASTLGGGGAVLYRTPAGNRNAQPDLIPLERSTGLPVKIINGGRWFIVLDGEGGICWHDNRTGKLLAVFRLYQDSTPKSAAPGSSGRNFPETWTLESNGKIIRGTIGKR
ncbi:MAG: WD40 repeat domain-containing protein [Treponema sp.]|nr:WD40 repeat domain-containing protein [Treponema sp.]